MKEKIGIIGSGYVESKICDFFQTNGYLTCCFDTEREKSDIEKLEDLNKLELDFAFICVPTPMAKDGNCDSSIVEKVIHTLKTKTYVIESTIAPGTTRRLEQEIGKDILILQNPLNNLGKCWACY